MIIRMCPNTTERPSSCRYNKSPRLLTEIPTLLFLIPTLLFFISSVGIFISSLAGRISIIIDFSTLAHARIRVDLSYWQNTRHVMHVRHVRFFTSVSHVHHVWVVFRITQGSAARLRLSGTCG